MITARRTGASRLLSFTMLGLSFTFPVASVGEAFGETQSPPQSLVLLTSSRESALGALKHEDRAVEALYPSPEETIDVLPMTLHDAFCYYGEFGSKEAVPLLIQNLSAAEVFKTKTGRTLCDCTWSHLVAALKAQTGKDFGFEQGAWQQWWDHTGKDLPESYFDPKKHRSTVVNGKPVDDRKVGSPKTTRTPE